MPQKILLIGGDPNSINSEIIYKTWKKISYKVKEKIILITNYKLIKEQFKILKYKISVEKIKDLESYKNSKKLKIIDVNLNYKNPFKVSKKAASKFVLKSLDLGHNLSLNKNVAGLINCPINKELLKKKEIGVTELLASKCKIKKNTEVMLIKNKDLIVSPITIHSDIKSISKNLNQNVIINKVQLINNWFKKSFKKKPQIAILGLNPHNAELRNKSEEQKIIIPAIKKLKKLNINIKGPLVADTIFIKDYKNFDVIVGMYHDQVLGPFKAIFKFNAINLTLGLNYIRVSPDHGTAKDKILKKRSNPESLLKCIEYFQKVDK